MLRTAATACAGLLLLAGSPSLARSIGSMAVVPASAPLQAILDRCAVVRAGDPLDPTALERTAALLRASGLFSSVSFSVGDGEEAPVRWELAPRLTISKIEISGNLFTLSSSIRQELPARAGDPYDDATLPRRFREAVETAYRREGFLDATVTVTPVPDPPFGFVIDIRIREGKPRVIRSFRFDGDAPFTEEELTAAAGIVVGGFWSESEGESMREGILSLLRKHGYIEATCLLRTEPLEGGGVPPLDLTRPFMTLAGFLPGAYPGVRVVAEIASGYPWKISLEGVPEGLEGKVEGALSFASAGTVDAYERERSKREIRRTLQREGYFEATSDIGFSWQPPRTITVRVKAGRFAKGHDLAFSGASIDSLPVLREAAGTVAAEYPQLTDDMLGRLRETARSVLVASGHREATVPEPAVAWHEDRGKWLVTLIVEPGDRHLLGTLSVEGLTVMTSEEAAGLLGWREGEAFDAAAVNAGKQRLIADLRSRGLLTAATDLTLRSGEGRVAGTLAVREGEAFTNGFVAVIGSAHASVSFIGRIADIAPGSPAGPAEISAAQLALYRTGLFSRVVVEPTRGDAPGAVVDYLVMVDETAPRRLGISVGYGDRDGWRGQVSLRHLTLLGGGEEGYLSAKISEKNQEYELGLRLPYLPKAWTLELAGYRRRLERSSFTEETTGGTVSVAKTLAPSVLLSLAARVEGYEYPVLAPDFSPVAGSADAGTMVGFPFTARYDSRNDPFLPASGSLLDGVVEYSPDVFGTGEGFWRFEGNVSSFITPWRSLTLGLSVRGGTVIPTGGGEVPLRERYFLGGATSVRGFVPDGLGPKDGGENPLGGRTMVAAAAEIRFPLSPKLQGACFIDAGGVFLGQEVVFADMGESVGVGARYLTPIGPVRLDLAWRLDPKTGEDPFRAHFTLGYPF